MLDVTSAKVRLGILFAPVDQLDKDIRHCPPVATLLLDQYEENHIDGLASMSFVWSVTDVIVGVCQSSDFVPHYFYVALRDSKKD